MIDRYILGFTESCIESWIVWNEDQDHTGCFDSRGRGGGEANGGGYTSTSRPQHQNQTHQFISFRRFCKTTLGACNINIYIISLFDA